jgi:hypothetical protein
MSADARNGNQTAALEKLLAMGKRLADAVGADIVALERGAFQELRTTDPEIATLAAQYAREVGALKASGGIKNAPPALVAALKETGTRLKTLLIQHERLVHCMRQASEGLVQTIAEEVEKSRKRSVPYNPAAAQSKTAAAGAIVYNKVV